VKKFLLALILAGALGEQAVFAQNKPGYYAMIGGDTTFLANTNGVLSFSNSINSGFLSMPTTVNYSTGYGGQVAVGYQLEAPIRVELEFFYTSANVANLTSNGATVPGTGSLSSFSGLVNVYYDSPKLADSPFRVYVGGGIGFASVNANGIAFSNLPFTGFIADRNNFVNAPPVNAAVATFAYQGRAGVSYDLSANTTLNLGYRYFGTSNADLVGSVLRFNAASLSSSNIELGIRVGF